jgi:cell division protein FtsI (penicillin-binding protein 3)
MSKSFRNIPRERVLASILLLLVLAFGARLVQLQVFQHIQWRTIAQNQSLLTKFQKPSRGEIRDRSGMPLAVTLPLTYAVGFRPVLALNFDAVAGALASCLSKPRHEIRERLNASGFSYIARRVDWDVKQQLEALSLGCLQFDEEPRRSYPSMTAAAVLGFADRDNRGVEGVEASLNDELSGEAYRELCRVDALRNTVAPISPVPTQYRGANVTLTLDLQVQTIVEEKLREGLKGHTFERACAVMVDPRTGDVLAMATLPTFDSNRPGDARPEDRKCWPITDVLEPGSVLKIVPIAKALESHKLNRNSRIFCENGAYQVPGKIIHDTHRHGFLTVEDVLAYSSNIGAAKISQQFSPAEIYDKLRAFGFGNPTLIGIAGEQAGEVPPPSIWSGPTQATLAFGQGISVTPLQLTMAYAAIANGGLLLKPRLVRTVEFPSGTKTECQPEIIRRVIPSDVAAQMREMLVSVVEYGTGTPAKVAGMRVGGKTGTASKVDHEHHTYYENRYVSSFAGFFPADDPRYVLMVMVDDPRGVYYGATVAGPIFKAVVEEMNAVRPDEISPAPVKPQETTPTHMAVLQGSTAKAGAHTATYSTTALSQASRGKSGSDSVLVVMPAVEGWPLRMAVQELSRLNLSFRLSGSRTVLTQYPPAGTLIPTGTTCELLGVTG